MITLRHWAAYTEVVAESLKVDKDKFEAAIRALLNTPPTPMSDIPRKRERNLTDQMPRSDGGLGGKKANRAPKARFPSGTQGLSLAKKKRR